MKLFLACLRAFLMSSESGNLFLYSAPSAERRAPSGGANSKMLASTKNDTKQHNTTHLTYATLGGVKRRLLDLLGNRFGELEQEYCRLAVPVHDSLAGSVVDDNSCFPACREVLEVAGIWAGQGGGGSGGVLFRAGVGVGGRIGAKFFEELVHGYFHVVDVRGEGVLFLPSRGALCIVIVTVTVTVVVFLFQSSNQLKILPALGALRRLSLVTFRCLRKKKRSGYAHLANNFGALNVRDESQ